MSLRARISSFFLSHLDLQMNVPPDVLSSVHENRRAPCVSSVGKLCVCRFLDISFFFCPFFPLFFFSFYLGSKGYFNPPPLYIHLISPSLLNSSAPSLSLSLDSLYTAASLSLSLHKSRLSPASFLKK